MLREVTEHPVNNVYRTVRIPIRIREIHGRYIQRSQLCKQYNDVVLSIIVRQIDYQNYYVTNIVFRLPRYCSNFKVVFDMLPSLRQLSSHSPLNANIHRKIHKNDVEFEPSSVITDTLCTITYITKANKSHLVILNLIVYFS